MIRRRVGFAKGLRVPLVLQERNILISEYLTSTNTRVFLLQDFGVLYSASLLALLLLPMQELPLYYHQGSMKASCSCSLLRLLSDITAFSDKASPNSLDHITTSLYYTTLLALPKAKQRMPQR